MQMIDFTNCKYNARHGRYGGQAGDKDGISYCGENWMIKYPKSTKDMHGKELAPYTLSPLSEYIGSHVYSILGYDVHETLLGERNGQIVVACKDFQKHIGELAEVRMLKNAANKELLECTGQKLPISATGDSVNLEELMLHFEVNPLLRDETIVQRFWDSVIIDILIDNNDRNNGNWGLLYNESTGEYQLAPVYDCGNAFFNKASEKKVQEYLDSPSFEVTVLGGRTIYTYHEQLLSAKKLMSLDIPELQRAILKVVPHISEKFPDICEMILDIPETYHNMLVCSNARKELYIKSMAVRKDKLLLPTFQRVKAKTQPKEMGEMVKEISDDFALD